MLDEFNTTVKNTDRFDACAGGDGGDFGRRFGYLCLGIQNSQASAEISSREKAILAGLSPALKASFMALRTAHNKSQEAYSDMRGQACDGGTGCGPILEDDDLAVARSWLGALKAIQTGSPPCSSVSASAFVKIDGELNQRYKEMLNLDAQIAADVPSSSPGVSMVSLDRDADRAWLAYRDAWVRFGQLRWPAIPADQWRAWQTQEWISLLSRD
jgi:uncharacterized protein YecT (DUF1311 family)